ncbi:phage major capsid protein [Aliihoeflea aestuarii]|uniref:phage major capsid protein n=1 Tax=Aliihoeflea aestuarii TaxID=453840 RepID=UPI002093BD84|nr:phage major capsid protein [Aliihoeflea aestuarii]MCO6389443.1 phage major capsid protein [Aliihoeflea aestuarii]
MISNQEPFGFGDGANNPLGVRATLLSQGQAFETVGCRSADDEPAVAALRYARRCLFSPVSFNLSGGVSLHVGVRSGYPKRIASMNALTRHRGIVAIHANSRNTDLATVLAEMNSDLSAFRARQDGTLAEHREMLDDINTRIAQMQTGPATAQPSAMRSPDPAYTASFGGWIRDGRDESEVRDAQRNGLRASIQASMSVGTPNSGGYLAPVEWDRQIIAALEPLSPMRRLARVVSTTVGGYSTLWNGKGWGSGWVGETAARPQTESGTIEPIEFTHGEIYANPAITQRLLDDADYNVANFITDELAEEFAKQEGVSFIAGNGINKPRGLLTYVPGGTSATVHPGGTLDVMASGAAAALGNADSLIDFVYGLPAPYRRNARWLMNSTTAATIAKMKDGQDNYLWRETYVAGQPATLLGYPVEIDENMPDIAADALPIAFGDFQAGYVINDRIGVRMLRDPYTNKPFVHFYATKRVGGGVRDPRAIRLMRIGVASEGGN